VIRTWFGGKGLDVQLADESSCPNMICRTRVQDETGFDSVHPGIDHRSVGWLTVDLKADWVLAEKSDIRRVLSEVRAANTSARPKVSVEVPDWSGIRS